MGRYKIRKEEKKDKQYIPELNIQLIEKDIYDSLNKKNK